MTTTGRTRRSQKSGNRKEYSAPKKGGQDPAGHPLTTRESEHPEKDTLLHLVAEKTSDVLWVMDVSGTCSYVSPSIETFTGYTAEEFVAMRLEEYLAPESLEKAKAFLLEELTRKSTPGAADATRSIDLEFLCRDGSRKWGEVRFRSVRDTAGRLCKVVGVTRDDTDRFLAEREREAMLELHRLTGERTELRGLMQAVTAFLKRWSGCDAIGIRLREGEDCPYYETSGFPLSFVMAENRLCAASEKGEILRDSAGNAVLECMCGNILCGRFNPELPFFTDRGSFWSNSTTELLAGTTEADRQARTRNRCNGEGYESVALVPLRFQGEILGLLQFNDRRKGRFTKGKIALLERLAGQLAVALAQRKTRETLEESERRFRKLSETMPAAIYLTDPDGRCTYVNDRWCAMAGLSPEEATGDGWINGIHPEDREDVFSNWNRMVESEGNWGLEYRFRDREGKTTWVYGTAAPIRDGSGQVTGYVGTNLDIGIRKMAAVALQESERRYRIVADNTWDWEFWVGSDGRYRYVSPSSRRVTGYGPEEFLENPELFEQIIVPEDLEAYRQYEQDLVHFDCQRELEFRIRHRDGSLRWIGSMCGPVYGESGRFLGMRGSNRDITKRKQTEDGLRRTTELIGSIREAQALFIDRENPRESLEKLLDILVRVTESEYGFLDEVLLDGQGKPYKSSLAFSNIAWDEESKRFYESAKSSRVEFRNLSNLAGAPAVSGKLVIANDPAKDARSGGSPPGHPPIRAFMGIPMYAGGELVGVAGVANREGGYDEAVAAFLEPLISTCAGMIQSTRFRERELRHLAEIRCREENEQALLNASMDALFLMDRDGRLLCGNKEVHRRLGTCESDIGRNAFDFLPAEVAVRRRAIFDRVVATGAPVEFEDERGGRRVEQRFFPIQGPDGEVERVAVFGRDITEHKQAEEKLRFEREQLLSMFDSMETLVYVSDPSTHEILYVNRALENVLGRQVVGGICHRVFQGLEAPCPFCTNEIILRECPAPHCWEYHNPELGKDFSIVDRIIKWPDGRDVRIEFATDITVRKQAEEALWKSEERFRLIASSTPDYLFVQDRDLRYSLVINPQLGLTEQDMIGKTDHDFLSREDADEITRIKKQVLETGGPLYLEMPIRSGNGGQEFFSGSFVPTCGADGRVDGLIGYFRNVTERRRAEEALRGSEHLFRTLTEEAMACIYIVQDRVFKLVNPNAAAYCGRRPEEMIGAHSCDIIHPDDRESAQRKACSMLRGESDSPYEFRVITPQGEVRWILETVTSIVYEGRRAVLGNSMDITELKRAAEALRSSEEQYRRIVDTASEGIWAMDAQRVTNYVNARMAEMLGCTPDDMLGRPVEAFMFEEDLEDHAARMRARAQGEPGRYEHRFRKADGGELWTIVSATALTDEEGRFAGSFAMFTDITERKAAEERLQLQALVLDQIEDCVTVTDLEGRITYVNDAECRGLQRSREELIGLSVESYGDDPGAGATQREIIGKTLSEGQWHGEVANFAADGRKIILECRTQLVRDEAGKPIAMCGIATDITVRKRAEEDLRQSETRFRSLVENAPDGIYVQTKGTLRYANPAALRILGAGSPDQLIGRSFLERIHPDFREQVRTRARTITEEKKNVPAQDQVYLRLDGTPVDVEVSVVPIQFGGEDGGLVFMRDITERKEARKALAKSEEQYRILFDNMMSGFAVHEILCDQDGRPVDYRFTAVNAAFERVTGLRGADIVGRTAREILPDLEDRWVERYGKVALEGRECYFEDYSGSLGKHFDARAFSPERGKVAVLFHDITERKLVEEALVKSEEQYRNIFENALEGIFRSTAEGRYVNVNPALVRMFGYGSPEEMIEEVTDIGRHLYVDPGERDRCIRILEKEGALRRFEVKMRRRDGSTMWSVINSRIVRDEAGRFRYIEGMISDVTDLKRAEEALRESERRLRQAQKMESIGTLAGGIAHDFNNILAAIIGYTEMSLCGDVKKKQILANLEHVLQAGLRAKDLVKQILTFSRQGDQELRPILIHSLLKEAVKMLRASLPATIRIRQNIRTGACAILGDPTQIHQVVMNLATNAAHAMHEAGGTLGIDLVEVTLDARDAAAIHSELHAGAYLKLAVSDTGCGIDPSVLHRIFDPFFTTKEPGEGTGMGLAVAHGIVKSHGGVIVVESEPGKGAVFEIYFPVMASDPAVAVADVSRGDAGKGKGKGRILFVDDEEALTLLTGQLLSRLGYEVVTRTNGVEALEAFRANPDRFDLVLTDQTMPQMTGFELAQEMLRIRPDIPIILCTGFSEAVTPEKAKSVGIREYLMKPLVMRQMTETITRILETQGELRLQYGTRTDH